MPAAVAAAVAVAVAAAVVAAVARGKKEFESLGVSASAAFK